MLYKLLHRDSDSREDIITVTSGLGIIANLLIATTRVLIGVISSSIAIVSEGVNNFTDVFTSILASAQSLPKSTRMKSTPSVTEESSIWQASLSRR